MRLLGLMENGYGLYVKDGQFFILFLALLFAWYFWKKEGQKLLFQYSAVMVVLLLFPVTAFAFMKYQTAFYDYVSLYMLLPQTLVMAYGFTLYEKDLAAYRIGKKGKQIGHGFAILSFAVLLFLCGSLSFFTPSAGEEGKIFPDEVEEVLRFVDTSVSEKTLFAPDEISEYARVYNGKIKLCFGRNLWEPALQAYTYDTYDAGEQEMHDWLQGELKDLKDVEVSENYFSLCSSKGLDYLVFETKRLKEEGFLKALEKQTEYEKIGETKNYVIYRLI